MLAASRISSIAFAASPRVGLFSVVLEFHVMLRREFGPCKLLVIRQVYDAANHHQQLRGEFQVLTAADVCLRVVVTRANQLCAEEAVEA